MLYVKYTGVQTLVNGTAYAAAGGAAKGVSAAWAAGAIGKTAVIAGAGAGLIGAGVVIYLGYCMYSDRAFNATLKLAGKALEDKDYNTAIEKFSYAHQQKPDDLTIKRFYELSILLKKLDAEDYAGIIAFTETCLEKDPRNAFYLAWQARAFEAQDNTVAAEECYDIMTQVNPDDAQARMELARLQLKHEKFKSSEENFALAQQVILEALRPKQALYSVVEKAPTAEEREKLFQEEQRRQLKELSQHAHNGRYLALSGLASQCIEKQDLQGAESAFDTILSIEPKDEGIRQRRLTVRCHRLVLEHSYDDMLAETEHTKDSTLLMLRGQAWLGKASDDKIRAKRFLGYAFKEFSLILDDDKEDIAAHEGAAMALRAQGEHRNALVHYQKIATIYKSKLHTLSRSRHRASAEVVAQANAQIKVIQDALSRNHDQIRDVYNAMREVCAQVRTNIAGQFQQIEQVVFTNVLHLLHPDAVSEQSGPNHTVADVQRVAETRCDDFRKFICSVHESNSSFLTHFENHLAQLQEGMSHEQADEVRAQLRASLEERQQQQTQMIHDAKAGCQSYLDNLARLEEMLLENVEKHQAEISDEIEALSDVLVKDYRAQLSRHNDKQTQNAKDAVKRLIKATRARFERSLNEISILEQECQTSHDDLLIRADQSVADIAAEKRREAWQGHAAQTAGQMLGASLTFMFD